MDSDKTEACGRCSMTAVVDATDGDNPFDGDRIEVDPDEMRTVAKPAIALGRLKERIDEFATRLTYGR